MKTAREMTVAEMNRINGGDSYARYIDCEFEDCKERFWGTSDSSKEEAEDEVLSLYTDHVKKYHKWALLKNNSKYIIFNPLWLFE